MSSNPLTVDAANLSAAFPRVFHKSEDIAEISRLAGDASSRMYYRVKVKKQAQTWILQTSEAFTHEQLARHPFISMLQTLEAWGVPVPALRGVAPQQGWVLLEDLGDLTLQHAMSLERYRDAVDEVVRWTIRSCEPHPHLVHFAQVFDFEKLQAEMQFTATHLIEGLLQRGGAEFLESVAPNSQYLSDAPRFLCHRDYHSRNVMFQDEKIYIIDFQDARMGPVTYDMVSLLWDPYVRMSESWRDELLSYWKQSLTQNPECPPQLRAALTEQSGQMPRWRVELERMKVQRLLKAAGSYASFYRLKGRTDYLDSVKPALDEAMKALVNLQTLGMGGVKDEKLLTFLRSLNLDPVDILVTRA